MPNMVAYAALFAWPVLAVLLFRRLPAHWAIIWTLLGGYLLLPVRTEIDLPLLPAFDKTFLPAAAALACCLPLLRSPGELLPRARTPRLLVLVFLLGPFVTVALNGAPSVVGVRVLPGLTVYDAFSFGLTHAVLVIPFLLGQRFLAGESARRALLAAIAAAGLAYSLPALFEVRMSPQLHIWIYGFFPHSFVQQMRFDGFRPVVFLGHGLGVALFFSLATLAAAALWRGTTKGRWVLATGWLAVTLVLCKSVGALAYATLLAPVILFGGRTPQRLALLGIGLTVLLYPALRGADLMPVAQVEALAAGIDEDRAQSLRFRFDNEDILLARAAERPLFGWGGWGRSRVFDPATGEDLSTTDGAWVVTIGQYGWLGYAAEFGLLVWPLLILGRGRVARRAPFSAMALALILAANLIDLIPNSGLTPLTWLIAGALTGALARAPAKAPIGAPRPAAARAPSLAATESPS
jgi:hypothetical protein